MNGEKKSPMMPIIIVLGLVILAGIIYAATRSNEPESAMMDDGEAMMEDNSMEGDNMAGGTMLEGSEMPDNGMVGGDAMAPKDDAMMEDDSMMKEDGAMMEEGKSGDTMMEGDAMMKSKGSYEAYRPEKLAMANSGDVVLFFHASWCPTCRALDASLNAGDIPDGLTILKVDYDTETELKQKYGVRTQHTLVQVDADGNMITSWLGGSTAADIAAKVK